MNAVFEKPSHTIGELISAILAVTNEADAKQFVCDYAEWLSKRNDLEYPADEIIRGNIGWCFGEGMTDDKIAMWRKVCDASHPWFGAMETKPTANECYVAGKAMAEKARGKGGEKNEKRRRFL